ncbi:MAG: sigma-70 family RNA polymerase sigma factor [Fibrobacter sp.]|nr:sigma-70 family RNA polymerase sigma factor [Fibrobacter sp.]
MDNQRIFTESNQKLERVWKENATQIYKLCSCRSNSPEAADDLFQDVALKFCKNACTLNLDEPMYHWFSVVVKNAHHDQFRRRLHETPFSRLAENVASYDVFPTTASIHFNDDLRQLQVEKDLDYLMSELSGIEKRSIELTYFDGLSLVEASVHQRVSRRVLARRRRGAFLKMQKKREDQEILIKKNDALAQILSVITTQAG